MIVILLDTNVVLDYLLQRDNYEEAKAVINLAIESKEIECITASTITDIHYVAKGYHDLGETVPKYDTFQVQEMIEKLLDFIEILGVNGDDIRYALSLHWKDFEDALQYSVAVANGVDCIITNNKKDFKESDIEVITPGEFVKKYSYNE